MIQSVSYAVTFLSEDVEVSLHRSQGFFPLQSETEIQQTIIFQPTTTVLDLYSRVQEYFFLRWLGSDYFLAAELHFFPYVMQFVKSGKFHQSLGQSNDVQIQTCTSILFLFCVFTSRSSGDVGVWKHPTLLWDAAGKEALDTTLKGPNPFDTGV